MFVLVLLIGEAFVPGLVLGSLAIGAIAGGLTCLMVDAWEYQVLAASAGSLLSLMFLRPVAMRHWFSGASVATGVDALPGRTVRMTESINPSTGRGRGRLDGDDWLVELPHDWPGQRESGQAGLNDAQDLKPGDELLVVRVESNVLIVVPNTPQ